MWGKLKHYNINVFVKYNRTGESLSASKTTKDTFCTVHMDISSMNNLPCELNKTF